MYDKKIRENCYNEICLLQKNGLKKCIFNNVSFMIKYFVLDAHII